MFYREKLFLCALFYRGSLHDPAEAHAYGEKLFLTRTLFYTNYAINFCLYCLTGATFVRPSPPFAADKGGSGALRGLPRPGGVPGGR